MEELIARSLWIAAGAIVLLIAANGFFAASEIALISARRGRILELAQEGDPRAKIVRQLQEDRDRMLATVQIGVTFVGTLASAVGGALAVEVLKPILERLPVPGAAKWSEPLAIGAVTLCLTYLLLVAGELVPKSLAWRHAERVALAVARPIAWLSRLSGRPAGILAASSRAVLRLFGANLAPERHAVTEEEIKLLIREGREVGVFDQTEQELIHSVFEFTDTQVKEVMVPRPRVHALAIDTPPADALKLVLETGHSRYPVYGKNLDDVRGVLYYKDLVPRVLDARPGDLANLLHPAYFVPETTLVSRLLEELQRRRLVMAIVVDEYGSVEGLVTLEDLVEEIVGEIRDEHERDESPVQRLRDGSLLVDASLGVKDLRDNYGLPLPEAPGYETLAGFVLAELQRIPRGGEVVQFQDLRLTVVDMDGRRVARVKVERTAAKP